MIKRELDQSISFIMKRIFKWIGMILGGLLALLLLVSGVAYVFTEVTIIGKTYQPDDYQFSVNNQPVDMEEGIRLAKIRGCYNGCHGKEAEGGLLHEIPFMFRLVAPNLTQVMNRYSDIELERAIRQGISPDGTSTFAMPSSMFYHLSDKDLSAIISAVRGMPVVDGYSEPEISLGVPIRIMMLTGQIDFKGQRPLIEKLGRRINPPDTTYQVKFGEYLARTSCTECHGMNLEGAQFNETPTPNLAIVAAYSLEDFTNLMRKGVALGGRENKMSEVALARFTYLTDPEIIAVHTFLSTLIETENPSTPGED